VSSWDAGAEDFDKWLARRLGEEYTFLQSTTPYGRSLPHYLVTSGRILPLLDGLDEIGRIVSVEDTRKRVLSSGRFALDVADDVRSDAIRRLAKALGGDRRAIIACRTAQFEYAAGHGGFFATAEVKEVEDVDPEDARQYLEESSPDGAAKWGPFIDFLRLHPESPARCALSTPLMFWLLRTSYGGHDSDARRLLDTSAFCDVRSIILDLLDRLLPALYESLPSSHHAITRSYAPEKAQRWLKV
jgi:hypothetical protein